MNGCMFITLAKNVQYVVKWAHACVHCTVCRVNLPLMPYLSFQVFPLPAKDMADEFLVVVVT